LRCNGNAGSQLLHVSIMSVAEGRLTDNIKDAKTAVTSCPRGGEATPREYRKQRGGLSSQNCKRHSKANGLEFSHPNCRYNLLGKSEAMN